MIFSELHVINCRYIQCFKTTKFYFNHLKNIIKIKIRLSYNYAFYVVDENSGVAIVNESIVMV